MFKKNLTDALNWSKKPTPERIRKIFLFTYLQLSILFVIAVFLKETVSLPSYFLNFTLFGYLLPVFALPLLLEYENNKKPDFRVKPAYVFLALTVIFVFTAGVRFLPYTNNSVPLGYDPGFYKYAIDLYLDTLPAIPEDTLPLWVKQMHEQGFFVLFDVLHIFTGIDSLQALVYLTPLLSALLLLPIFIFARLIFDEKAAVLASMLYAVSYTQFTAFTFMYLRNILGLFILLFALYALEKKKYAFIAVMFAALGIYHRPEFLLFSLILVCYLLKDRDVKLMYPVFLAAVLISPFWLPRIDAYLSVMSGISDSMLNNIQGETGGSGTFFNFNIYEWVSLAYLPFAIIGAMHLIHRKMWNSLLFYFTVGGIIVVLKLFFFNRLIIDLDIAVLMLASAGMLYTFLTSRKIPQVAGIIFIGLLIVSGGIITLQKADRIKPMVREGQINSLEWLSENIEDEAFILTTSYDAPWALGWSKRRIIAPGLFEWDSSGKEKWLRFLSTSNSSEAEYFLKKYNETVYIYYSFNKFNVMNLGKFNSSSFVRIMMKDAAVYGYYGNN